MVTVMMEEIPYDLIIICHSTGLYVVPGCKWTMEKQSCKCVEIAGIDDKKQINAVIFRLLAGKLLPFPVIYQAITKACLPNYTGIPLN